MTIRRPAKQNSACKIIHIVHLVLLWRFQYSRYPWKSITRSFKIDIHTFQLHSSYFLENISVHEKTEQTWELLIK